MRKDFFLYVFFFLLLLSIAASPFIRNIIISPARTYYPIVHRIHEDYYYDLMVIKQGRIGFEEIDQYTTENISTSRVHIFYLLLGRLGNILHLSDVVMYYIAICISLFLFYIFTIRLIHVTLPFKYRWWATCIVFLASPLPRQDISVFPTTINVGSGWWTGMDIFSRLTMIPHHFFSLSLMIGSVYYVVRFMQEKNIWYALYTSILLFLSILFFAIPGILLITSLLITLIVFFLHTLYGNMQNRKSFFIRKNLKGENKKKFIEIVGFLMIFSFSLIAIVTVNQFLSTPHFPWGTFLKWEYETYRAERYPYLFIVLILSYGILPIFFTPTLFRIIKRPNVVHVLLLFLTVVPVACYLLSSFGLLMIPKIRFVYNGGYVFAGILTILGIDFITQYILTLRMRRLFTICVVGVFFVTTVLGMKSYWWPELLKKNFYENIYIPIKYMRMVEYINKHVPRFSHILSSYYTGVYLPAFTYNKVFIGHEVNTYDFWNKWNLAAKFFSGGLSTEEVINLIHNYQIQYILWEFGSLPEKYNNLFHPIFYQDNLILYKVK